MNRLDEISTWVEKNFMFSQALILIFIVVVFLVLTSKKEKSKFRYRESERDKTPDGTSRASRFQALHDAYQTKKKHTPKKPFLLEGIRIDGPPHEILGIPPFASAPEIQAAYRKLMKQYHPDKVSAPGTPQWQEAQKIAHAITEAKEMLLKKIQKK